MNALCHPPLNDRLSGRVAAKDIRNEEKRRCPHSQRMKAAFGGRGFAAIELVVVIALLAFLATMLAPALSRGRDRALTAQCLSNKRQLAMACQMYSAENNGYLVLNAPVSGASGLIIGWCPSQENWGTSTWNTNAAAYRTNCLGPYLDNVTVYKCPADTIPSDNGNRIRSISMNPALVGGLASSNPGAYRAMQEMISGWQLFAKVSDLGVMGASKVWVFCDESMYSLNDGYLECSLPTPGYPDVPAAYHGGGNCFSFADGHGEFRKWRFVTTDPKAGLLNCPYAKNVSNYGASWNTSGLDVDWQWLRQHTSCSP